MSGGRELTSKHPTPETAIDYAIDQLWAPTFAEKVSIDGPNGERISDARVKAIRKSKAAQSAQGRVAS